MPSVGLYTLGCKVSQYETEAVGEAFEKQGFEILPFEESCDVYFINTCTVTAESDRKSRQIIRRATSHKNAVVAVAGCYSQTACGEILKIPGVDIVIGNGEKLQTVEFAVQKLAEKQSGTVSAPIVKVGRIEDEPFEKMTVKKAPRTRAYVKIEDGCECRCTYCEIPNARGLVRSKLPADVIAEVEALHASGTKEIVLTGIETASYGTDFSDGYRLIDLLEELDRRHSADRIRLGSLTPELMKPAFVERMKKLSILVPHFHLSMQSGSDNVLRGMKRRYNRQMALDAMARTREAMPDVQFTTDLMVGFPGETEENFEETLDFVRRARFLSMHVFAYSRRPGTPAAGYDGQVAESIKHDRSRRLIAEGEKIRDGILSEIVREGSLLRVIPETAGEGYYEAHSDSFVAVRVLTKCDLRGELIYVKPVRAENGILYAEPVIDN
ncbi:MAG: tRNA (N(6)-L-threonylcarbamoyladenosine(37)-C(2))-methylthiotransferase MtaB [Clostridia bacterium]|nr:tRNA (N(6)-L-threonylcarbamoyladenosine(37)-C(2))-methylthiotransferase MtaB [Clostridia bacterium]